MKEPLFDWDEIQTFDELIAEETITGSSADARGGELRQVLGRQEGKLMLYIHAIEEAEERFERIYIPEPLDYENCSIEGYSFEKTPFRLILTPLNWERVKSSKSIRNSDKHVWKNKQSKGTPHPVTFESTDRDRLKQIWKKLREPPDIAIACWKHPRLGRFQDDGYGSWEGEVKLPVFAKFGGSTSKVKLVLNAEDEETPDDGVIETALKTIANIDKLVTNGLRALFDDFSGEGPESGMWWHNAIDDIREDLDDENPSDILNSPDDLFQHLSHPSIQVNRTGFVRDRPCSVIGFESRIDQEHGIGLLTDGSRIIGLGYRADPSEF